MATNNRNVADLLVTDISPREEAAEVNPFTIPSDDDIFRLRDEDKRKKLESKALVKNLKVIEKTTASSRIGKSSKPKECVQSEAMLTPQTGSNITLARTGKALMTASTPSQGHREKENMSEFLAKKREMFLVQMALDTKREEIKKLEEKAQMKEEALRKSEQMLDEDAVRFDAFLKENDRKAHEAIKRAEKETKAKNEKVQEIKKLNQQIQVVQSEMSKLKEQLEDCLKHKKFLDDLTPPEFFEHCAAEKKKRQVELDRLESRKAEMLRKWEADCQAAVEDFEFKERAEKARLEKEGRVKKKGDKSSNSMPTLPPRPNVDELQVTSSEEEYPMYFQHPEQLLGIFTTLEESNLFLIQNSQETEQALEKLKQDFHDTQAKMNRKTQALELQISELQNQIRAEEAKAAALRARVSNSNGQDPHEKLLYELHLKVKDVYKKCGFDADSNPSTLFMLTDLESRLEELLRSIQDMPEDYVAKAEKEKEKERRERVRQERLEQQQKMYEERMKKSIERSMQAPKKKQGRRIMYRSAPLHQTTVEDDQSEERDDNDADSKYFS